MAAPSKSENDQNVIVYAEDEDTKKKLGGFVGFTVHEQDDSKREGYDKILSYEVPLKELQKRGIKNVMSKEEAGRKRFERMAKKCERT